MKRKYDPKRPFNFAMGLQDTTQSKKAPSKKNDQYYEQAYKKLMAAGMIPEDTTLNQIKRMKEKDLNQYLAVLDQQAAMLRQQPTSAPMTPMAQGPVAPATPEALNGFCGGGKRRMEYGGVNPDKSLISNNNSIKPDNYAIVDSEGNIIQEMSFENKAAGIGGIASLIGDKMMESEERGVRSSGNLISGIGKGVATGATFGPVGAAIGGVVGLGAGIATNIRDMNQEIALEQDMANNFMDNANPYGFNAMYGGRRRGYAAGGQRVPGGMLQNLSSSGQLVQANQPQATDSVGLPDANVNHNEVLSREKVFSDDVINPKSGKSYADDAKQLEGAKGKIEKELKTRPFDKELMASLQHTEGAIEKLFMDQEQIASNMGLRQAPGVPVQNMKWGGKKFSYEPGGSLFN